MYFRAERESWTWTSTSSCPRSRQYTNQELDHDYECLGSTVVDHMENEVPVEYQYTMGFSLTSLSPTWSNFFFLLLLPPFSYTLKFKDRPKFPGPTPLVKPLGPKNWAYSSGTQDNWTLARPCW
jgi:hypothetical protein